MGGFNQCASPNISSVSILIFCLDYLSIFENEVLYYYCIAVYFFLQMLALCVWCSYVGYMVSPLDLFRTLPVGGGLLVPCSLAGLPVVKQLMQIVTMVPGQGGQFQSVCFP